LSVFRYTAFIFHEGLAEVIFHKFRSQFENVKVSSPLIRVNTWRCSHRCNGNKTMKHIDYDLCLIRKKRPCATVNHAHYYEIDVNAR